MKSTFLGIAVVSLSLLAGCGASRNGELSVPGSGTSLPQQNTLLDGSDWTVRRKSCGSRNARLITEETLQFRAGGFIHSVSQPSSRFSPCEESQVYLRTVQSLTTGANEIHEVSVLTPRAVHMLCHDPRTGGALPRRRRELLGPSQMISTRVRGRTAFVSWEKASECPYGTLRLSLTRN